MLRYWVSIEEALEDAPNYTSATEVSEGVGDYVTEDNSWRANRLLIAITTSNHWFSKTITYLHNEWDSLQEISWINSILWNSKS